MSFQEAIRQRIYELCTEHGYTPNGLAEASCVPPSTLGNITSCRTKNPSTFIIFQLCIPLNITLKDFFDSELFIAENITFD